MLKSIVLSTSALALIASPIAASAANPASKLSLSSNARANAPAGKSNRLTGAGIGPIAAGIILAGIAIGGYFLIDDEESEDDPDSN